MKYVRTFESFRNNKNSKVEPVNEEILGAIGKFFGNMFKKAKEMINKTKGGKEVEEIYQKYLKLIDEQFSKQANVKLNLSSIAQGTKKNESMIFEAEAETAEATSEDTADAAGSDAKMTPDTLKEKNDLLTQIVNKMKKTALSEMDAVLKKYGGSAKSPQLAVIIQTRKDQFDLDFMNAKIAFLEKAGDKTMVGEITKQRDAITKKIEASLDKVKDTKPVESSKEGEIEYKEGDKVTYKRKDGSENQAEFVKIDGEDVTLKTEKNPNGFAIKKDSLIGKVEAKDEGQGEEKKTEGEEKKTEGEEK